MKFLTGLVAALMLLVLLPTPSESAGRGGRFGLGYSLYPVADGLATLRYDSYKFYFEGGLQLVDAGSTRITFGSKFAVKPWEYYGVPVEMGGSVAFVTDGTSNDKGEASTLIDLGFFMGLSTLVTDQVSVGVAVYPLALGLGGAETVMSIAPATFNIHFLF